MNQRTEFRSHISARHRVELERLVFFNVVQERFASDIVDAVEMFGAPEIVSDGPERLRVSVTGLPEAQSLFAVDAATGRPMGLAIYTRPDLEHITVLHVSISAEYASGGVLSNQHLLLRLLREVRRSTRRVKGVRRLNLYYGRSREALPA